MDEAGYNTNSSTKNQEIVQVIERMIGKETEKVVESLGEKRWAHIKNYPKPPKNIRDMLLWLYYLAYIAKDDPANNRLSIQQILSEVYFADVRSTLMSKWHRFQDDLVEFSQVKMGCLSIAQIDRILNSFYNEFFDLNLASVRNTASRAVPLWKVLEAYIIALEKLKNTRISREIMESNRHVIETPINQKLNAAMEHPIILESIESVERSSNRYDSSVRSNMSNKMNSTPMVIEESKVVLESNEFTPITVTNKYGSELRHYISKKRVQRDELHTRSKSKKNLNMYASLRSNRSCADGF